jgi:trk system potassium uptake protein TrkA
VIGCGRVGSSVALALARDGWEVTAVDETEEALNRLGESWEGGFVVGHGMDLDVLREAGIEDADAVVISTNGDNTNLVVSQIAQRRFEVTRVIARVLDPRRAAWYSEQGVQTICPTQIAIEQLEQAALSEA